MSIALTIGSILGGAAIGGYVVEYLMKCECARRGYGRWHPENRQWQWYTRTGLSKAKGFFG